MRIFANIDQRLSGSRFKLAAYDGQAFVSLSHHGERVIRCMLMQVPAGFRDESENAEACRHQVIALGP